MLVVHELGPGREVRPGDGPDPIGEEWVVAAARGKRALGEPDHDHPVEFEAEGLLAVCVQHEIDHLDGRLFVDYLSQLKRQRIRKKANKQQRQAM